MALRFSMYSGVPKSGAPFWVTGSFDAIFQKDLGNGLGTDMDHVTGTFTAPVCDVQPDGETMACGS